MTGWEPNGVERETGMGGAGEHPSHHEWRLAREIGLIVREGKRKTR